MIPEQKKNPAIAKKPLAHRTDLQSRMQLSIVELRSSSFAPRPLTSSSSFAPRPFKQAWWLSSWRRFKQAWWLSVWRRFKQAWYSFRFSRFFLVVLPSRRLSVVSARNGYACINRACLKLQTNARKSMQYKQGFCRFWFMLTQEFTGDPESSHFCLEP